jgi:hypothetical protein
MANVIAPGTEFQPRNMDLKGPSELPNFPTVGRMLLSWSFDLVLRCWKISHEKPSSVVPSVCQTQVN